MFAPALETCQTRLHHGMIHLNRWISHRPLASRRHWRLAMLPVMALYLGGTGLLTLILLIHANWGVPKDY